MLTVVCGHRHLQTFQEEKRRPQEPAMVPLKKLHLANLPFEQQSWDEECRREHFRYFRNARDAPLGEPHWFL